MGISKEIWQKFAKIEYLDYKNDGFGHTQIHRQFLEPRLKSAGYAIFLILPDAPHPSAFRDIHDAGMNKKGDSRLWGNDVGWEILEG